MLPARLFETSAGILYKGLMIHGGSWVVLNEETGHRVSDFADWGKVEEYFNYYLGEPIKEIVQL